MTSCGQRESFNSSASLKTKVWYPVLDYMLSEINCRFAPTNLDIMKSLQACRPSSSTFLDSSQLSHLASFYNISVDLLSNECVLAKRALQEKDLNTATDAYRHIVSLQAAFPTLKQVFQIALTLAVSTAQCEWSFSAVKRIKTYLRTSMSEKRLTDTRHKNFPKKFKKVQS